ncbi:hypothetical protein [Vibrio parahaemolyticus]|uniref:hypothetical protein n=1 Tax=Vibrio parahaemolyticus TaxID=670 RepID=UPI00112028A1|nr:hypothetical protein [Vibrio parahaemolyticus]TOP74090.1 hypothetical protein CGH10_22175 [Vibrio parahaemolyticus]
MSTQEIGALIESVNEMTGTVAGKMGQIDQRMDEAEQEFDSFKADADSRYLNVVSATASGHKLKNVYFGDWETDRTGLSSTPGANALILAKKIPLSVDPAIRGDMAMIGTINALRIHTSKGISINRFLINYSESYTGRLAEIIPDEFAGAADWEIREVMLPSLDANIPFYVLSRTSCLDSHPGNVAFLGKMTFDGVFGHLSNGGYNEQYKYTGQAIILSDCGYTKPGA